MPAASRAGCDAACLRRGRMSCSHPAKVLAIIRRRRGSEPEQEYHDARDGGSSRTRGRCWWSPERCRATAGDDQAGGLGEGHGRGDHWAAVAEAAQELGVDGGLPQGQGQDDGGVAGCDLHPGRASQREPSGAKAARPSAAPRKDTSEAPTATAIQPVRAPAMAAARSVESSCQTSSTPAAATQAGERDGLQAAGPPRLHGGGRGGWRWEGASPPPEDVAICIAMVGMPSPAEWRRSDRRRLRLARIISAPGSGRLIGRLLGSSPCRRFPAPGRGRRWTPCRTPRRKPRR